MNSPKTTKFEFQGDKYSVTQISERTTVNNLTRNIVIVAQFMHRAALAAATLHEKDPGDWLPLKTAEQHLCKIAGVTSLHIKGRDIQMATERGHKLMEDVIASTTQDSTFKLRAQFLQAFKQASVTELVTPEAMNRVEELDAAILTGPGKPQEKQIAHTMDLTRKLKLALSSSGLTEADNSYGKHIPSTYPIEDSCAY